MNTNQTAAQSTAINLNEQTTIKNAHRDHVVRCLRDGVRPLTLDQFFVRAIAAVMLPVDRAIKVQCTVRSA